MSEKITKATLIPVGLVMTIIAGVWFLASYKATVETKIDALENRSDRQQERIESIPTRQEYNNLESRLSKIEQGIDDVKRILMAK